MHLVLWASRVNHAKRWAMIDFDSTLARLISLFIILTGSRVVNSVSIVVAVAHNRLEGNVDVPLLLLFPSFELAAILLFRIAV